MIHGIALCTTRDDHRYGSSLCTCGECTHIGIARDLGLLLQLFTTHLQKGGGEEEGEEEEEEEEEEEGENQKHRRHGTGT